MVVVGCDATVIDCSGKCADVRPFPTDCSRLETVRIIDMAVAYDCPYSLEIYLLVIRNALYVPSMQHHLILPFITRKAGLTANDVAKINTNGDELTKKSYSPILRRDDDEVMLRIHLQLDGIVLCFLMPNLTQEE